MSRIICLACIALVMGITGCDQTVTPGPDVENATTVSFEQFREATAGEEKFFWVGSDPKFHYFETKQGYFRISIELKMPDFQRAIDREYEPGSFRRHARIDGDTIAPWSSRLQKRKDGAET